MFGAACLLLAALTLLGAFIGSGRTVQAGSWQVDVVACCGYDDSNRNAGYATAGVLAAVGVAALIVAARMRRRA